MKKLIKIIFTLVLVTIVFAFIEKGTGWDTDYAVGYLSGCVVSYFVFSK